MASNQGVGPAGQARSRSEVTKVVVASLIGTTIEWYDFFLYGTAAALVFNKLFFPKADPLVGTMLAFTTYALGFFARPVGGVVFGHYGDRIGRKAMLVLTLMMMGLATFAIGLLPTYATLGIWAAVILTLLRLIQGFALGGEWGGAVLIVAERDRDRRGFWASWPQAGAPNCGHEVMKPRFLLVCAHSIASSTAPPHSPPTPMPWIRRSSVRMTAPQMPIES